MVDLVSLNTLGDDALTFFRDVLRNNLTDKRIPARSGSNWIFKSRPDTKEIALPNVILTEDRENADKLTIDPVNGKMGIPSIRLDVRVWADHINHRDEIADEIVKIFKTPTSGDGTTTLLQNHFVFKRYEKYEEDGMIADLPKVMRIKRIMVDFRYIGG